MTYRKATIRPYRTDDESLLFSLARESFGALESWSDDAALRGLETDTVFVAELEGDRAGYVAIDRRGPRRVARRHPLVRVGRLEATRRLGGAPAPGPG